jgi:hypothetical protein
MSAAVLRRIAMVVLVAVLVWGALALFNRRRTDAPDGLPLPAVDVGTVEEIRFGGTTDTARVVRDSSGWSVNGYRASSDVVLGFLGALRDSSNRSELIARSTTPHARLGLDSATARHVTVRAGGKVVLDLLVGSRGPEFEGFYVRRPGEAPSFLLRGRFAEELGRSADDWREKTIAAIGADSITGVTVRLGRSTLTLAKGANGWTLGGSPADSAKVARYLGGFASLRAEGFPDPQDLASITFSPAEREVALLGPGGRPLETLTFDSAATGAFWVRTAEGVIYRVSPAVADRVTTGVGAVK